MFVKKITTNIVKIGTPAKVNLFLQVLNRRPDNFHNINSLFQAVSLFDRLTFEKTSDSSVTLSLSKGLPVTIGTDNLIRKAVNVLKSKTGFKGGLSIELEKNIPVAAGLGGGSSDGAAAIVACNILYGLGLSISEMAKISLELGSDLPFFFSSGQAIVTGRGEVIDEVSLPRDYWMLLVTPNLEISTADSYRALKRGLTDVPEQLSFTHDQTVEGLIASLRLAENDFERVHFESFPELALIRKTLVDQGAVVSRMSGSGPTVYGIFDTTSTPEWEGLTEHSNWNVNIVKPISLPRLDLS